MNTEWHTLEEKYWQGETTLEEEARLKQAAAAGEAGISEALRYAFAAIDDAGGQVLGGDFDTAFWQKAEAQRGGALGPLSVWMRYAAAAVVLIAVTISAFYLYHNQQDAPIAAYTADDTFEDPEEAFRQAVEALQFASEKLNHGQQPAREIRRFHQTKLTIAGGTYTAPKDTTK